MKIVLISTYEMGHQPFGLASPAAWLRREGHDVFCLDTTTALFRKILEVNLLGSFVVAREAARVMRGRGKGSIVNIASVSGLRGNSGRVAYGASPLGAYSEALTRLFGLADPSTREDDRARPGTLEPFARNRPRGPR